jgi:hypothetical protein
MKLVNGDRAIILSEKLLNYCLNPEHHSGKHKARVFASALGITAKNPEDLRQLIARAAYEGEVVEQTATKFGQLFKVDWLVPYQNNVELRTIWEITIEQPYPRLVSAFIK